MDRVRRLTGEERQGLKQAYLAGVSMSVLVRSYHRSRQAIWHILRDMQVDTSRYQVQLQCDQCEHPFIRSKAKARQGQHHFCSLTCSKAWRLNHADPTYRHIKRLMTERHCKP